jgi:hypothetical protein
MEKKNKKLDSEQYKSRNLENWCLMKAMASTIIWIEQNWWTWERINYSFIRFRQQQTPSHPNSPQQQHVEYVEWYSAANLFEIFYTHSILINISHFCRQIKSISNRFGAKYFFFVNLSIFPKCAPSVHAFDWLSNLSH